jgi:restriction system protein
MKGSDSPLLPHGGFTENLYAARKQARAAQEAQRSDRSDKPDTSDSSDRDAAPTCPKCSAPMRLRHAHKGPHAGGPFWGCTNYPECDGLRDAAPDRPPN